ncbi:hypothetical protein Tco_1081760 [Tanacetum coccineum]|uniref:Uncharacterized protein n=1 Tax=Tanacetum coccineum TaxID=301880 RepID=A0ABQ5HYU9_9ASTR
MVAMFWKSSRKTLSFIRYWTFPLYMFNQLSYTVSPTIYASYIEQFSNTATSKTVNSLKQIHAVVDDKAVVISESSVRNDLLLMMRWTGEPQDLRVDEVCPVRNTKVPQSGGSPKKVGDEAINEAMFDSVERAITTDASLDAA